MRDPEEVALGAVMDDAGICAPLQAVAAVVPGFEKQLADMGGRLQVTKCTYEAATAEQRAHAPRNAKVSAGGSISLSLLIAGIDEGGLAVVCEPRRRRAFGVGPDHLLPKDHPRVTNCARVGILPP